MAGELEYQLPQPFFPPSLEGTERACPTLPDTFPPLPVNVTPTSVYSRVSVVLSEQSGNLELPSYIGRIFCGRQLGEEKSRPR